MSTTARFVCAALIAVLVVGAPLWYRSVQFAHYRSLHVVTPGKLYRCGQLDPAGLSDVVRRHGIQTIICLRDADTDVSRDEEAWARQAGLRFVRIPYRSWARTGAGVPAEVGLGAFRKVIDDTSGYPVLIHCFAGFHRTGSFCAIYRMDFEGWSNREALDEMKMLGYTQLQEDADICEYLENYQAKDSKTRLLDELSGQTINSIHGVVGVGR